MKAFEPITKVFSGWSDILSGSPKWRNKFDPGTRGVLLASFAYVLVFVLVLAAQSAMAGRLPQGFEVAAGFVFAAMRVLSIYVAIVITRLVLRFQAPMSDLLTPAIYAVAALLVLQLVLSLFSIQLAQVMYGALAYMLFKLGRTVAGLSIASAIAFAVLSIVLLVGMPLGLYMLLAPGPGPI